MGRAETTWASCLGLPVTGAAGPTGLLISEVTTVAEEAGFSSQDFQAASPLDRCLPEGLAQPV